MNLIHAFQKVTVSMNAFAMLTGLRRLALVWLLALPLAGAAAEQRTFATPEAAVDALAAALKGDDVAALTAIFGEKYRNVIVTGDRQHDAARRAASAAELATFRLLDERGSDRRVLLMGEQARPFAIPLVREGGSWRFATEQGVEELLNRRVGANERNAIYVLRAYLAAQRQYASRDRDGDGVLQYATKFASTPGKQDGLYWPADAAKGEELSPFGPLIAESSVNPAEHKRGAPFRGYRFKLLTAQGRSAPGGAYSYVINGRMIAGFAMVAYPDEYGRSGVMTFMVSHNGKVYQKNLGANSAGIASNMTRFDPGAGWTEVAP
jgi:hypothetical protein